MHSTAFNKIHLIYLTTIILIVILNLYNNITGSIDAHSSILFYILIFLLLCYKLVKNIRISLIASKYLRDYYFWFIALSLTSTLTLTHIRMYGHDTNGWTLPARTWFVSTLRQGDVPLWFNIGRYGFPSTVAQFVGYLWSPVAIMLAPFEDYSAFSISREFFLWRIIALLGVYWFARTHLQERRSAVIVSAVFIGSGMFASQDGELVIYSAMAMVPWVIGGIDRCIHGTSYKSKFLGSGVIGISGGILAWSGYPGVWLTLPLLLIPYIIYNIYIQFTTKKRISSLLALFCGACLSSLFYSPVVFETIQFPVFGEYLRDQIDPNLGALDTWGLAGLFFANPTYILGNQNYTTHAWVVTIYDGIVPVFASILYLLVLIKKLIITNIVKYKITIKWLKFRIAHKIEHGFFLVLLILLIFNGYQTETNNYLTIIANICVFCWLFLYDKIDYTINTRSIIKFSIVMVWLSISLTTRVLDPILGSLALLTISFNYISKIFIIKTRKDDYILLISITWIIFWSTSGQVQNFARFHIPPLMFLRWHAIQMYCGGLLLILFGWRTVLERIQIDYNMVTRIFKINSNLYIYISGVSIVLGEYILGSFRDVDVNTIVNSGDQYGGVPLVFTLIYFVIYGTIIINILRARKWNSVYIYKVTIFYTFSLAFTTWVYSYVTHPNIPSWWDGLIAVPQGTSVLVDFLFFVSVIIVLLCIINKKYTRSQKIELLGLIGVLDTSISSVRYLGDQNVMNESHRVYPKSSSMRVIENSRSLSMSGHPFWLAESFPHLSVYPGLVPKSAALDESLGLPTVFRNFAIFPAVWEKSGLQSVDIKQEIFKNIMTACGADGDDGPKVHVKKLLSTSIVAAISSPCSRLLVWTDSWSRGWTVQLNGTSGRVLRVNDAIRGVMVDAGNTDVRWDYSPPYWFLSYPLMIAGFAVSCGFIALGSRD